MGSLRAKQFSLHVTRAYTLLISRPWKKKSIVINIAVGEGLNLKEQTITVRGGQLLHLI